MTLITMIAPITFVLSVVLFLLRSRALARRRATQSWGDLVSKLQPGWDTSHLHDCLAAKDATPEERWKKLDGARGLYMMYTNAKVMLEMANYAARNSDSLDRNILAQLHSDALQIRVSVGLALVQYAIHQLNERICANGLRAACMYSAMTERMSELLQANGAQLAFVGAR